MSKLGAVVGAQLTPKAATKVGGLVKSLLNDNKAKARAEKFKNKYSGLPSDAIADRLILNACRKTKWEGAGNGGAITGLEALLVNPEPTSKPAVIGGIVGLLLSDIGYTTKIQIQLMLEIGALYGAPYNSLDEEDVWIVFKAALGSSGAEKVGGYLRFIYTEAAKKQFRKLLRSGLRRSIQNQVLKIAGKQVAKLLSEKAVMRLIPILNAAIGYYFNNIITKKIGKWAKVKSKIRVSAFSKIFDLDKIDKNSKKWVLPIIYSVGTADDKISENLLALYSQSSARLALTPEQDADVVNMIDRDDFDKILESGLKEITKKEVRKILFDIALTAASINLSPTKEHEDRLKEVGKDLSIIFNKKDLKARVKYLNK